MTIYRCTAQGISNGSDEFMFGLHLSDSAGSVGGALDAFTAFIDKLWNGDGDAIAGIGIWYATSTQLQSLVATALSPTTGKNVSQAQGATSLTGTGSGESLPGEVAVCVSLRTGVPTRSGRGRFFLPNPIVSCLFQGLFETSMQGDVVEAAAYALDGLIADSYPAVIYHRTSLSFTGVNSVDVGDVPDVQRRRRNKLVESRQSLPVA